MSFTLTSSNDSVANAESADTHNVVIGDTGAVTLTNGMNNGVPAP